MPPRKTRKPGKSIRPQKAAPLVATSQSATDKPAKSRGYRLGERNPATLPGITGESVHDHNRRSREWRSIRRTVQNGATVGHKYV